MSAAAAGDGRRSRPFALSELTTRVASAIVLAAFALAGAFLGGWATAFVLAVVASIFHIEWALLTEHKLWPSVLFTAGLVAALAMITAEYEWQGAVVAAFAVVLSAGRLNAWRPVGTLYAAMLGVGMLMLRLAPMGLAAVLVVLAAVWATDTGAFFVGRAIGGAKLLPAVSPNKTWAGALGGLAIAIVVGLIVAAILQVRITAILVLVIALLSVVAQAGDLFESWVKRRFGAKDSSNLVPGHGGFMDRVDGLAVASGAALLIGWLHGGGDVATGLLHW